MGMSRGLLVLTFANALYIVSGYALTVALARLLLPAGFGSYNVVAAVITVVNMVVTKGLPVAASRVIAAEPERARSVMAVLGRTTIPFAALASLLMFALAWPLAELFGDEDLRLPFQIAALAALSFAVNAYLLAYVNGMREFGRQAVTQVAYAAVRVVTIVVGTEVAGLKGAIAGFILAPLLGAIPAITRWKGSEPVEHPQVLRRDMLMRSVPMISTAVVITLLLTIDMLAFKRVANLDAVGVYAAAATLAHVPFFLLQAAAFVLLPNVAHAHAQGVVLRGQVIRNGLADTVVLLALPTALLVAVGDTLLPLIFGAKFETDAMVVAPLAIATAFVTMHAAFVAIDAAIGHLREAVLIGLVGAIALAAAVTAFGDGSDLAGAAWAAAAATGGVALVHGLLMWRRLGTIAGWRWLVAVALAALVSIPLTLIPDNELLVLGGAAIASVAYALLCLRGNLFTLKVSPVGTD